MGQNLCSSPATDKDDWDQRKDGKLMLHNLYDDPAKKKQKSTSAQGPNQISSAVIPRAERAPERGPQTMAPSPAPVREAGQHNASSTAPKKPPMQASSAASASASQPARSSGARGSDDFGIPDEGGSTSAARDAAPREGNEEPTQGILLPELSSGKDWKATEFLRLIAAARSSRDEGMTKRLLKQVAESNYVLRNNWKVPRTISVTARKCSTNRVRGKGRDPEVSFSLFDTADAIRNLAQDRRRRICALNFANGEHVGGGYKNGAQAQEEDLCRRIPSLYTSLNNAKRDGQYPFGPCTCRDRSDPSKYSDVLYTKGLVIARAGEAEGFALLRSDEQVMVSLVTAAAPNVNFARELYDLNLMYETIKTIFVAPVLEEKEINTLVLGAWGCGAFGGDPEQISELFVRAITDGLGRLYNEVHFAIPEGRNANVFRAALERNKVRVVEIKGSSANSVQRPPK